MDIVYRQSERHIGTRGAEPAITRSQPQKHARSYIYGSPPRSSPPVKSFPTITTTPPFPLFSKNSHLDLLRTFHRLLNFASSHYADKRRIPLSACYQSSLSKTRHKTIFRSTSATLVTPQSSHCHSNPSKCTHQHHSPDPHLQKPSPPCKSLSKTSPAKVSVLSPFKSPNQHNLLTRPQPSP